MQLTECGTPPSAADVQEILPHLTPKQLAEAVSAFAQHEAKPSPGLMDAIAQEIQSKLPQFRAQDLSNVLWAFATLKFQPSAQWWRDFERQLYGALHELKEREVSNLLWAFAVLERRPTASATGRDAGQRVSAFAGSQSPLHGSAAMYGQVRSAAEGPSGLGMSCASPGWVIEPLLAHSCANSFAGYSAGSLHLLVWSLGKLNHQPSAAWLEGFLPAVEAHFFRLSPTELTNVVWALAKLGKPRAFACGWP
jgi:hypothetical protein